MSPSGRFVAAMDANPVDDGVAYFLTILNLEADEPLVAREQMLESTLPAIPES